MPISLLDTFTKTATIAAGGTTSDTVDLEGYTLAAVYMPAAFTGTALAVQAAPSRGGAFLPVHKDDGTAVSITAAASRVVGIDLAAGTLAALRYVQLVSNAAEAGERALTLLLKRA